MRNNVAVVGSGNGDVPEQGEDLPFDGRPPRWRSTTDNVGTVERSASLCATPQFDESLIIIEMIINNIQWNRE